MNKALGTSINLKIQKEFKLESLANSNKNIKTIRTQILAHRFHGYRES